MKRRLFLQTVAAAAVAPAAPMPAEVLKYIPPTATLKPLWPPSGYFIVSNPGSGSWVRDLYLGGRGGGVSHQIELPLLRKNGSPSERIRHRVEPFFRGGDFINPDYPGLLPNDKIVDEFSTLRVVTVDQIPFDAVMPANEAWSSKFIRGTWPQDFGGGDA